MVRFFKFYILLLIATTLLSCGSDDDADCVGVTCLPPATQTGAGTFGCLVNGVPYVDNSGGFNCFYQEINGEFFFGIQARDTKADIVQVFIGSNSNEILTQSIISFGSDSSGQFYAGVNLDNPISTIRTDDNNSGTIQFSRLSVNPNIVSATFSFTVTDPTTGTVYNITDGRFDSQFTQ